MYFSLCGCEQWKEQCLSCPAEKRKGICGTENKNFKRKKAAFCGVRDMTVVAVSKWIGDLVNASFLKDYPVEVRYNKIDRNIFKPT